MISRRATLGAAAGGIIASATSGLPFATAQTTTTAQPEVLGPALMTVRCTWSGIGRWTDGRPVLFANGGQSKQPAQFAVIDIADGSILAQHTIDNSQACYDVAVDGDLVYLASLSGGHIHLYRPSTDTITDLGMPLPDENVLFQIELTPDTIYGGTGQHGHVFAMSRSTGAVTDYGTIDPTEKYIHSTAWDPDAKMVYAGTEPNCRLYRLDPRTGVSTRVELPEEMASTGQRIYDMAYRNGFLFCYTSGGLCWWVLDVATGQWVTSLRDCAQGGISGVDSTGAVYVVHYATQRIQRFDPTTRTFAPVPGSFAVNGSQAACGIHLLRADNGAESVVGLGSRGEVWRYDLTTSTGTMINSKFPKIGVTIRALGIGPTAQILVGGSAGETTYGQWCPQTKTFTQFMGGPNYRIDAFANLGGKINFTYYGSAGVYEHDPAKPFTGFPTNPRLLFNLAEFHQERIYALIAHGDQLIAGSVGGRGIADGRLVRYDTTAAKLVDLGNPLPGHSIASLTMVGASLLGGTSVQVLAGTSPEPTAKLFFADPTTGAVQWSGAVPKVAGLNTSAISEVTTLSNGQVWALLNIGYVIRFDPTTRTFHESIKVGRNGGEWGMGTLHQYGTGDVLYGATGSADVFAVDISTGATRLLATGEHAVIGADQLYWADDSLLVRLALPAQGVLPG